MSIMQGLNYHILNGDALAERFPKFLVGEKIIFRECLCQGPINLDFDQEFIKGRSAFLQHLTGEKIDYEKDFVSELERLNNISEKDHIYCWFEYDLYCQINLWFLIDFMSKLDRDLNISLVLPPKESKYSFAHCSDDDLKSQFDNSILLDEDLINEFKSLWEAVCKATNAHFKYPKNLTYSLDIVSDAILSFQRLHDINREDNIRYIIKEWMKLSTDFVFLFKKFSKEESSFGFGDLQFKYLIDHL